MAAACAVVVLGLAVNALQTVPVRAQAIPQVPLDKLKLPPGLIATNVPQPAGVAFRNGALYYSSVTRIFRLDDIEHHLDAPPTPVVVYDKLPANGGHNWRYIAFGPDGLLYIGLGSPCNVCDKELTDDPRLASIARMKPDGTDFEVFAHGVRNSVGFDWHPVTHEIWFSDNGRDNLGDDIPSDELNVATKAGQNFGYPYCHQGDLVDPDVGKGHTCAEFVPPILKVGPHVASIGLKFYTGSMFPPEYKNAIFVAQHGSWNRSAPIGYRVMAVKNDGRKVLDYQPFVNGFLTGVRGTPGQPPNGQTTGNAFGRPADTLVLKDGSLLISDDQGGRIFRVTYGR
jgi:glucose/arabinose dehydrogenase